MIISQPVSTLSSQYPAVAPANTWQVLKYYADFSAVPYTNSFSAPVAVTFNPNITLNFGVARSAIIDTRFMLSDIVFSVSDSLNDYIRIPPGRRVYTDLGGGVSDTYTATLNSVNVITDTLTYYGFAKILFFNYLRMETYRAPAPRRVYQSVALTSGGGAFYFEWDDYQAVAGFPSLRYIKLDSDLEAASAGLYSVDISPLAGAGIFNYNLFYNNSSSPQLFSRFYAGVGAYNPVGRDTYDLDLLISPQQQLLPGQEGQDPQATLGVPALSYEVQASVSSGATGGNIVTTLGVEFPP